MPRCDPVGGIRNGWQSRRGPGRALTACRGRGDGTPGTDDIDVPCRDCSRQRQSTRAESRQPGYGVQRDTHTDGALPRYSRGAIC